MALRVVAHDIEDDIQLRPVAVIPVGKPVADDVIGIDYVDDR